MKCKKCIWVGMVFVFFFAGCINKEHTSEFNKPALYWYQKIGKSIGQGEMDRADKYYISLKSEHIRSPLMPTAMMMLAHAHMNKESYLLANHYFDEYNKRYGEGEKREYADFMNLKAAFLGIKDVYKDQKLIMDSIANGEKFLLRYADSAYAPLVNTILVRLHMSQYLLNENIAALYARTGKKDAAQVYREKNSDSTIEMTDITPPEKGVIGKIFD